MQVSPYQIRKAPPKKVEQPNLFDLGALVNKMNELASQIESVKSLKEQMALEHKAKLAEVQLKLDEHLGAVNETLDNKVNELDNTVAEVLKREPVAGVHFKQPEDGKSVDETVVVQKIMSQIRQPKDGDTPVIDEKKIAKLAASLIPKPKDGKTPVIDHESIVETIIKMIEEGKLKLKTKHIDGFDNTFASLRSQIMRGGGDTVTAGSNITITTLNGVKTISSSGGSGFSTLAATETPDGTTTIFTFASASAQPSYIVSDNVWLKATTASGTVNWTWNGGTKKATLTIPPTDDLWAVV